MASSKADPVYASTQPSLPSYSAAGKDHYVGGGVGQGGLGVGTGVQQVYIVRSARLHSSVPLLEPGTPRFLVVYKNE